MFQFKKLAKKSSPSARQGTQTHQNLTYAKDVDKMLYFVQNKSFHIIFLLIFWKNKFGKKFFILTCARKGT